MAGKREVMDTPIVNGDADSSASDASYIKDTTTADFVTDVIDASKSAVVLVDFWAPWCGPCKQLGPVLEKLVGQANGTVRLVKMNIDDYPEVASQLGVQSIPAVFAFKDGRPVDGFMGALPESQLKTFIERIAGPEAFAGGIEDVLETAQSAFDDGDYQEAAEVFAAVLGEDRENVDAIAGLAKCYIAIGEFDRAEETLALTPPEKKSATPITSAEAALALARKGGGDEDLDKFRAAVEKNEDDHQARFNLAIALNGAGEKKEAMDALFEIVKRDREWNDNAAQQQLVEFFSAWGPADECTIEGRRRLSSILFA